jgi:hypothetical protein
LGSFGYVDFCKASLYNLRCCKVVFILFVIVSGVVVMPIVIKVFFDIIDVASVLAALILMALLVTA